MNMDLIPAEVLRHCLDYVGLGEYRYIAGVSKVFKESYRPKNDNDNIDHNDDSTIPSDGDVRKKTALASTSTATTTTTTTTWSAVSSSLGCAQLWWSEDDRVAGLDRSEEPVRQYYLAKLCEHAASYGGGGEVVLEWAVAEGLDPQWYGGLVCLHAAQAQRFRLMRWAHEEKGFRLEGGVADCLAQQGQLEQLQWAVEKGEVLFSSTYTAAGMSGNLELIEWIRSQNDKEVPRHHHHQQQQQQQQQSENRDYFLYGILMGAIREERVHVFDWCLANKIDLSYRNHFCIYFAAKYRKAAVLRWFMDKGYPFAPGPLEM